MLGDTNEVEMTRIVIDAAAGPAHRVSGMFDNLIVKVGVQGFHLWVLKVLIETRKTI